MLTYQPTIVRICPSFWCIFNKTPLAPPSTLVLVHEKPAIRQSWDPRAINAWYIGPAMKHYRCNHVWIWGTQSERVADTLAWFPTRIQMPTISSADLLLAATKDLITALQNPSPGSPLAPTTDSQTAALKQLLTFSMTVPSAHPFSMQRPLVILALCQHQTLRQHH
jgi:hypothetical protein